MNDKFKRFKESLKKDKLVAQREEVVAGLTEMSEEQKAQRFQMIGNVAHVIDVVQKLTNPLTGETAPIIPPSESIKTFIQEDFSKIPTLNTGMIASDNGNYSSMPLGLREAQERNGVRDHGLGLYEGKKPIKGDFEWTEDKNAVVWVPSETGVFTVYDPDNLSEGSKNLLDRKFAGVPYVGPSGETLYEPKAIVEPELTTGFSPINDQSYDGPVVLGFPSSNPKTEVALKLNFGKSKKEEMTEKVEAYKEGKERIIQNEIRGFEPEVKTDFSIKNQLIEMGAKLPEEFPFKAEEVSKPKTEFQEQVEAVLPFYTTDSIIEKEPSIQFPSLLKELVDFAERQKLYIAIDPGKSGSICALTVNGKVIGKHETPLSGDDVDVIKFSEIIQDYMKSYDCVAIVEDVHSIFGVSASNNFTFGVVCGQIDAIVTLLKVKRYDVQPKFWQKTVWLNVDMIYKPLKPEQKKPSVDTKATSLMACKRLFPNEDLRGEIIVKYYADSAANRKKGLANQPIPSKRNEPKDGIVDGLLIAEAARRLNY